MVTSGIISPIIGGELEDKYKYENAFNISMLILASFTFVFIICFLFKCMQNKRKNLVVYAIDIKS